MSSESLTRHYFDGVYYVKWKLNKALFWWNVLCEVKSKHGIILTDYTILFWMNVSKHTLYVFN